MVNSRLVALYIALLFLGYVPGSAANIFSQFRQVVGTTGSTSQTFTASHDSCRNDTASPIIQVREVLPTKLQNEIDPELNQSDDPKARQSSKTRNWLWCGALPDGESPSGKSRGKQQLEEEHPLRTDLWKLEIDWFRRGGSSSIHSARRLQMEFHRNGHCRLTSTNDDYENHSPTVWGVGTWTSRPYGVSFSVPCKDFSDKSDRSYRKKYIFTAQLHHNPFGKQPKFQQGMIILEKRRKKIFDCDVLEYDEERDFSFVRPMPKQWFRPVVGKFTGEGIGVDTLDYSYSKRQ